AVLVVGARDARIPDVQGAAAERRVGRIPVGLLGHALTADRAADVEDAAVVGDRHAVALTDVAGRVGHVQAVPGAARAVDRAVRVGARGLVVRRDRRLAVAAHHARGPLDRAEHVRLDLVGLPGVLRAAEADVERAAVLEVTAPGHRAVRLRVRVGANRV